MSLKLPQIIGHRGACGYAPENTLESIHTAADMGVEWVEFDVKITKDLVPIIFHDDDLERTTNGHGLVAEMNYAEIKELDAGLWYAESFLGAKIPTLEEAVEVLLERDLGLNLELKSCPGREIETAEVALDHLSHIWDDHDRLLISSFSHVSLETAMDMANDWNRGLLIGRDMEESGLPENWKELANYLDVKTINVNGNNITRLQIEEICDMEYSILAYTVNDPLRARELQSWGVDGFFTDTPDVLQENLLMVH